VNTEATIESNVVNVVYIDKYSLMLKGVTECLNKYENVNVIGTGTNKQTAFELVEVLKPDILITNCFWENDEFAPELLSALKEKHPPMKIILLTMHFSRNLAVDVISKGVIDAYLVMSLSCNDIYTAVVQVTGGIGVCYFPLTKLYSNSPKK
jgi:DNA-binding NarL/FixJ family response regulator